MGPRIEEATMTKQKRKKRVTRPAKVRQPKQKRYTPPDCSMCIGTREALGKTGNYNEVYHTKHTNKWTIRYLRCRFCKNTSKHQTPRS